MYNIYIYNIDMYIYNIYNIDMYISLNIIENPSNWKFHQSLEQNMPNMIIQSIT